MELNGTKWMPATPDRVYQVLTDPDLLTQAMPGLKQLTGVSPGVYDAVMEMGVAAIRGRYQGTMRILDEDKPHSYRLEMKGQGPGGFVDINLGIALKAQEQDQKDGTELTYQGTAQVGGKVAGVGQRLMSGVASMILGQFFGRVEKLCEPVT